MFVSNCSNISLPARSLQAVAQGSRQSWPHSLALTLQAEALLMGLQELQLWPGSGPMLTEFGEGEGGTSVEPVPAAFCCDEKLDQLGRCTSWQVHILALVTSVFFLPFSCFLTKHTSTESRNSSLCDQGFSMPFLFHYEDCVWCCSWLRPHLHYSPRLLDFLRPEEEGLVHVFLIPLH